MKALIYILLSFVLVCCGSKKSSTAVGAQHKYVPLSLEQSKKLITPTIYLIPTFDQSAITCSDQKNIKDAAGKTLVTVCSDVFRSCELEGTCLILNNQKKMLLNVDVVVKGERRFNMASDSQCPFGNGARRDQVNGYRMMCLDPYHSVAADLSIYNLGDVIYIPTAVGVVLPDGSIHDGYFIVRDSGGAIKGYGRFDFFTGFKISTSRNPLSQIGFSDKETNVPYYVVVGSVAEDILKKRNFPDLIVKK
ncbi:MAG: 3D domain-containing protein [Pseudobdellovibrio sp.]